MIDEYLINKEPTDCSDQHHTTLKINRNGKVTGRRDTVKIAKQKASYNSKHFINVLNTKNL